MCVETSIDQSAGFGSHDNQFVGSQTNNYYTGMSPEQAVDFAMDLFWKNFPKLQATAEEVARKRVEEFCKDTVKKLQRDGTNNYATLADPGVQYALVDAQKSYARYGEKEMLDMLTEIVYTRVKHNDDFILKVTIDKALSIVNMITAKQLDLLSLMFICTRVKFGNITTLKDLCEHFNYLEEKFGHVDVMSIPYLNMLGCMQITLPDPVEAYVNAYGFDRQDIEDICPDFITDLNNDYGLSFVGIVLGIINAELKTDFRFNTKTWIHA